MSARNRMCLRCLAVMLVAVAAASAADAGITWIGPQIAFPVPGHDVGSDQLGVDAGVTVTSMQQRYVGAGVDVVYHYWPASPAYQATIDRYLAITRYQAIDASTWAFKAFQFTAHLKLIAPILNESGPWIQMGGGLYWVDLNIAAPTSNGGFVKFPSHSSDSSIVPGWYGSAGFDYRVASKVTLGLGATYHNIPSIQTAELGMSRADQAPRFSTVTVGTQLLFGW